MPNRTMIELLDEYNRYRAASPRLSDGARLALAERILQAMNESDSE